jgi:hypothetical protein
MDITKALVGGLVVLVASALASTYGRQALWAALLVLVPIYLLLVWRDWFGSAHWPLASTTLVALFGASFFGSVWWFGWLRPRELQQSAASAQQHAGPGQVIQGTASPGGGESSSKHEPKGDTTRQPTSRALDKSEDTIKSFIVETRLTARLREGAEIPPASVPFTPVGDGSDAKIISVGGDVNLFFVSPVIFRQLDGNRIVVINTFKAEETSPLLGRPLDAIGTLQQLVAHPVMIVWGRSVATLTLWEVSIHVNGRGPWYYSYQLRENRVPEGQVPILRVPLEGLLDRVR